jgi:hypothetical protein
LLLTTLLVLAIVASSALVFTNKVELLKLAVIVALWAAVVAAFVSFIYRRQADLDRAKSRDLKLVYDLQLDREISARREYELSIESQLRRELASELRAQASDEVASLRAELAALRANLEIIFDTDLQSRPAIETERTTVHRFGDWDAVAAAGPAPDRGDRSFAPGRVISSRIDTEGREDTDPNTEESPIIDVPAEPQPPEDDWTPQDLGGAHRRASEREAAPSGWQAPQPTAPRQEGRRRAPEPAPTPEPAPASEVRLPWMPVDVPPTPAPQPSPAPPRPPTVTPTPPPTPRQEPERVGRHGPGPTGSGWRPAPAEGQFIPAGAPGSNWASPVTENGTSAPGAEPPASVTPPPVTPLAPVTPPPVAPPPAMTPPPTQAPRQGRHYPAQAEPDTAEAARRARHSAPAEADPGRPTPPPTLAPPPTPPTPPIEPPESPAARHRGHEEAGETDEAEESAGQHIGGQPVSELMARLQVGSTGGGRRRRREE